MTRLEIPEGTMISDAIQAILRERLPDVQVRMRPPCSYATPMLVYGLDRATPNPWADAEDLATAIGRRLRYRGNRVTVFIPLSQRLRHLYWRYITKPIRAVRARFDAWRNPPVEWPGERFDDWYGDDE